ncbi:unnamed protein product [Arctia plantaginis]|uniref:Uncharacterized protein n=1 Tax=Arctia plantaginis TaxID=874455 RepID=A0A8S1ARV7_ARCPL|nr:unnamed protein product [Arctia plantaginis]
MVSPSRATRTALHKSEALFFHGLRRKPPEGSSLIVGGTRIGIEPSSRYQGLVLDGRWDFGHHFRGLVPKLVGAARALARLLPNMKGADDSCRRLYSGVVRSMALYEAPVWAARRRSSAKASNVALLRRPQRVLASRIIRGYRTISFKAASLLAGTPPWDLEAKTLAALYQWCNEARELGRSPETVGSS